jgi:hypothetical protein
MDNYTKVTVVIMQHMTVSTVIKVLANDVVCDYMVGDPFYYSDRVVIGVDIPDGIGVEAFRKEIEEIHCDLRVAIS